ncbi:uncharacterized protein LOC129919401 [Episyrphus balteatus]|uniref:uncharacterized protein LOC129919401 n=1 Tax=Episyrphus balteatus TaxID=286459 RepID=UPI0024858E29|nr:uncharacterized protein LOC129919401 [Episyrphus balteatus]
MADSQEPTSSTTTKPDPQTVDDVRSDNTESKPSPSSATTTNTTTTNDTTPDEVTSSFNPSVTEDEIQKEDLEKIKGDAIGNTLYSERFVLSTLLKLTKLEKDLSEDEPFEKDLCSLWNMTIEADVVKLLLNHNVPELFTDIIEKTEDKRLTEILVGIIANMCSVQQTRKDLCCNSHVMSVLLNLISCTDSLTLIQLMRFFYAVVSSEMNSGDEILWFQHFKECDSFIENFAFILNNSANLTLLVNALSTLEALCVTFALIEIQPDAKDLCFSDVFVQPCLVEGIIEAFKTLLPASKLEQNSNEEGTASPSKNTKKIMTLFLDINVILSPYEQISQKCYEPYLDDLFHCISQILSPLCQPIYLLPLTSNEQGIVENVNELFQAFGDPFHEVCFAQMISIWHLIDSDREAKENSDQWGEDGEENDEEVNSEDICMTILEFLTRTVMNTLEDELECALKMHAPNTILKLLSALSAGDSEEDIKECCNKIKVVFDKLQSEIKTDGGEETNAVVTNSC